MSGVLASVTSVAEAAIVLKANVDIIDIKEPHTGALGAQPLGTVKEIVGYVDGRVLTSATIGDIQQDNPMLPDMIHAMSATGVNIVKVGLFDKDPGSYFLQCLSQAAANNIKIVVVLFAEHYHDHSVLLPLIEAGIYGIMIDTRNKDSKNLCNLLQQETINEFVATVKQVGLVAGLAGSLKTGNVPALLETDADYLGFRGALCHSHNRINHIDINSVKEVCLAVQKMNNIRYDQEDMQQAL